MQEDQRYNDLNNLLGFTQYLIDSDGKFHFSSNKINTFSHDDAQVNVLKQILEMGIKNIPKFLCAPEYRDAIVFYDHSGRIVSTLNVCLSCLFMETEKFNYINADYETYDLFKRWFIGNGHQVENPNYFVIEHYYM